MNKQQLILTIDVGTQSIRCLLFDICGNVIEKEQVVLKPYISLHSGWLEQSVSYIWETIENLIQLLLNKNNWYRSSVIGISVTTQRVCMLPIDIDGNPLYNFIVWLDRRSCTIDKVYKRLSLPFRIILRLAGLQGKVSSFIGKSHSNWFFENKPDIWKNTYKYIPISTYLIFKLSGKYLDTPNSVVGYVPYNFKKGKWEHKYAPKWKLTSLKPSQLVDIAPSSTIAGNLLPAIAQKFNLSFNIPIVLSGSDKGCEVLGSGCLSDNMAAISLGTGTTLSISSPKYFTLERLVPSYPATIPHHYNIEFFIYVGFATVTWFKNQIAHAEVIEAEQKGVIPEVLFELFLDQTPIGNNGLFFHPIASAGTPGVSKLDGVGGFIGLRNEHTKANLYRAIIEGLFYELRYGKDLIEKKNGKIKIDTIRISGGGSQSDRILQIAADILGVTIEKLETHETSSLGAAIHVCIARNIYNNYEQAIQNMVKISKIFYPNAVNHSIYTKLYTLQYTKISNFMKKKYNKLSISS